ncbi:MAG: aspartate aminotransferase family protein [Desulfobacterales bacterium]|nr:aspartate aminotransferase family protein [Desulfobacterales bacterium]
MEPVKQSTIEVEDKYFPPFFDKGDISYERGEGVHVWDEEGRKYLDFTSGWGVTCIGHASPVITEALATQGRMIIQNPNSGATYSPARARLLALMSEILPSGLTRVFFSNSGAESNDAAIKLARKVTGRVNVISTTYSFHGRTLSALSATGQAIHRDKYNPLVPGCDFVPFNDIDAMADAVNDKTAAVILEPIQGEGGVNVPGDGYLEAVSEICAAKGAYLIVDEIQTGFCRTGAMFAISGKGLKVDFLTMAKGMGGGFPIGAFAVSEEVAGKIEMGDHGGTYCGNPLGCAVAYAVIRHLIDADVRGNATAVGEFARKELEARREARPDVIADVRGKGLLLAAEFFDEDLVGRIRKECLARGLILNVTKGNIIRFFPALNIRESEMKEGLEILKGVMDEFCAR